MKGNYITFNDAKQLLKCLRQFQTSNIYLKEVYFRLVILVRLLLQLAFKVDRNQLIKHLEVLISETQKVDEEGVQDYNLVPLSPSHELELEEICNELIFSNEEGIGGEQQVQTLRDVDELSY